METLLRADCQDMEVIILDNGSKKPETLSLFDALQSSHANLRVIRQDYPFNFSRLCNHGVAVARHPYVLLLNDDVEISDPSALKIMMSCLRSEDVGAVGPRLVYPSGDLQHAGIATHLLPGPGHPWRELPSEAWEGHPLVCSTHTVDAVTAACMMVRRSDYLAVGGMDEADFPITLNDVDLCIKLRLIGKRSIYTAKTTLVHKEGQSRESDYSPGQISRRQKELHNFYSRYPHCANFSCFYPLTLRRDTDKGLPI